MCTVSFGVQCKVLLRRTARDAVTPFHRFPTGSQIAPGLLLQKSRSLPRRPFQSPAVSQTYGSNFANRRVK
jgi:hypothetical protein